MLKIRLQRTGRKNLPTFRIVLTDSKNSTKSGKYLEILGNHDPRNDSGDVKADRVKYWMSQGAKLSDTLHNMFVSKKIIEGKKINVLPRKTAQVKEGAEAPKAAAPVENTPVAEETSAVEEVAPEVVAEAPVAEPVVEAPAAETPAEEPAQA